MLAALAVVKDLSRVWRTHGMSRSYADRPEPCQTISPKPKPVDRD